MAPPRFGLCDSCRHQQLVRTTRGSTFALCRRSRTDPGYPRYPRIPVLACAGHEERWDDEARRSRSGRRARAAWAAVAVAAGQGGAAPRGSGCTRRSSRARRSPPRWRRGRVYVIGGFVRGRREHGRGGALRPSAADRWSRAPRRCRVGAQPRRRRASWRGRDLRRRRLPGSVPGRRDRGAAALRPAAATAGRACADMPTARGRAGRRRRRRPPLRGGRSRRRPRPGGRSRSTTCAAGAGGAGPTCRRRASTSPARSPAARSTRSPAAPRDGATSRSPSATSPRAGAGSVCRRCASRAAASPRRPSAPRIVVVGGEEAAGTIAEVEAFDPARRRWTALPDLPTPRHGLGVVARRTAGARPGGRRAPRASASRGRLRP